MRDALWPPMANPATPSGAHAAPSRYAVAWAYARHELLYLCWALVDVALIAPAALAFMPWTYFWPLPAFVAWLLLILLIPFNLSRLMSIAAVPVVQQRRVIIAVFLPVLLLALRSMLYEPRTLLDLSWLGSMFSRFTTFPATLWQRDLALFALLALLWARGLALANRHVAIGEAGFRLRLGGLLLAPLIVILSLLPTAPSAIPFVMLFFLAALMAVALTRAEEVSRQQGAAHALSPRWVATIFLSSLLVVSAAALAGLALSGRGLQQIVQWLSPLWNSLALGGMVVVTTATYILLLVLSPLISLLRYLYLLWSSLGVEGPTEAEPLTLELFEPNVDQLLLDVGDSQVTFFLWLNRAAVVIFILLVLAVVYVGLRRYFYHRNMSFDSGELTGPLPAVTDAGLRLDNRLFQRLRRWRRWRAAATVRQLYRSMCAEAAARGFPRNLSQTPYEYLATLSEVWPAAQDDVRLITGAYVRVRYGEVPESPEELDGLRSAWQRLAQTPYRD